MKHAFCQTRSLFFPFFLLSPSPPFILTAGRRNVLLAFLLVCYYLVAYPVGFVTVLFDWIAGYGYMPGRSFLAYLIVILTFATTYFIIGRTVGPALSPSGALVFSVTSFHGHGFFPGGIKLDDPLTVLAALEAFFGSRAR
jgi:hypothetical protein